MGYPIIRATMLCLLALLTIGQFVPTRWPDHDWLSWLRVLLGGGAIMLLAAAWDLVRPKFPAGPSTAMQRVNGLFLRGFGWIALVGLCLLGFAALPFTFFMFIAGIWIGGPMIFAGTWIEEHGSTPKRITALASSGVVIATSTMTLFSPSASQSIVLLGLVASASWALLTAVLTMADY